MKINELNFMIGGKAGEGIEVPGNMFAKICMHAGLWLHSTQEFYSVIKGYNNINQIRVAEQPVKSHTNRYDLVLSIDDETVPRYYEDIVPGGGVIYDPSLVSADSRQSELVPGGALKYDAKLMKKALSRDDINYFPVPMSEIAQEKVGLKLARNIVGIGACMALLDYEIQPLLDLIVKTFARKGDDIVNKNIDAAQAGYNYVREHFSRQFNYQIRNVKNPVKKFFADGNEVMVFGAIKAGLKFVAEYPMTPSSSVLHTSAKYAQKYDISVNHVEDELSAMNMAVGAGYAGVRSLVATSGGGFALMTEAVGMAGMIEAPVVCIEVQRPGPSSGLPTRSGQGDLRQVMHASQGEFPRIVMAPGHHEEAFYMAHEAFNLAERYQCPVFIISEKYLSEGHATLPFLETGHLTIDRGKLLKESEIKAGYKRYSFTEDGICPRSIPGQKGGAHLANSYEHLESGYSTEEVHHVNAMYERRMKKMETIEKNLPHAELEGDPKADYTIVCWGGTYMPASEAINMLTRDGIGVNMLHVKYMLPLQPGVREILEHCKRPVLVEGNYTAMLGGVIAEKAGIDIQSKILDYSGRPFTPDFIYARVKNLVK
ncbi:2-oxoacid:acceptor oxidoreductase subunit alpha [Patescibacteria group bacterium]|nr:2-oxoacid:acceptor oxidoreductase subunit alpha [Patescibacteria group bacterium]MBU1016470.1 2-oxoacid:acceptor oxidoreductase subunit alpha [Patescibacteria group bacterium]MBU1684968.1 2-oxoacid:acceptor oxidoreductase subunit alpha [Patescibacteria group bacterium]MBU1939004.1 2-oxoacid:acceptor oxidoreductase subunit alpha [Patescibacteria group bacterium]